MNRVIVLILCLASAAGIAGYTYFRDPGEPTAVYVVPQRPPEPKPKPATVTNIDPSDRAALARALQRELKRVGCYSGEITGQWTTSSRMAMKAFTERVNATLPIDRPDPVLLSLVQGHQEKACGAACPAGQTATEGGACTPNAVAAKAAKLPGPEDAGPDTARDKADPALTAAGAAALALTAPAAKSGPDAKEAADEARRPAVKPAPREARTPDKPDKKGVVDAPRNGPVPPEGIREKRPRRSDQTQASRPPKVVRDVLKALGF